MFEKVVEFGKAYGAYAVVGLVCGVVGYKLGKNATPEVQAIAEKYEDKKKDKKAKKSKKEKKMEKKFFDQIAKNEG